MGSMAAAIDDIADGMLHVQLHIIVRRSHGGCVYHHVKAWLGCSKPGLCSCFLSACLTSAGKCRIHSCSAVWSGHNIHLR